MMCAALAVHAQTLERAEALRKARNYEEANNVFRALVAANPKNAEYRVRWGRLFLERFNRVDSAALFQEALAIQKDNAGALLGMALVAAENYENRAVEFAEKALASDPKLVEARELLARLALEDSNPAKAIEEADKALAISPRAFDAMAIHGIVDWLEDKQPDKPALLNGKPMDATSLIGGKQGSPWFGRILQADPHYGKGYALAGHIAVLNRRYEEGIAFYRRALEVQPDLWSARSQLGVQLMRLGEEGEAREELENCYTNHFRDDVTTNTLRLIDSYKNFVTFKSGNIVLKLHKKEAELLRPYFESELKRAMATYEKKYQLKLTRPVQLEVYPDHEDFAVRTMAMPGLGGVLGVTFGYVVAMDSPSGRPPGSFHWASTMWHELSHVYVLASTSHRAPRWFTEGMAVYEETAVSAEWGDRLDPHTLSAIKNKKLLPIAELDRGFVRPTYPEQVVVSYFQAGRICSYIAKRWGYDKLLAMMHDFATEASTAAVIRKNLGMEPADFDRDFLATVDAETRKTIDGFDEWREKLKAAVALARLGKPEEVIEKTAGIRDLYPEFVESGNVYEVRAEAFLATKNKAAATAELERYAKAGGRNPAALKKLATMLEEAGRPADAALALDRITYIFPVDQDLHQRLGGLWLEQGNREGAIREFTAALASKPLDLAASHYNLARAYRSADRPADAKEQLLLALEAAPGFRPAQRMLLELSR
jgi:tetratricopeptide (TPR) repeat protein